MTGNGHISQEDLAFYAMQNLSLEESASIRAHLQTCELCRTELASVCGDLALIAIDVPQQPLPEGARERFLARIAASPVAATQQKPVAPLTPVTPISAKPARGKGFWIGWATAAGLAIATVALGVQNRALNDELQDQLKLVTGLAAQASKAQQVLEVLTAPSAQRVTLTEGKGPVAPSARATYLPERGGLILLATSLKPLPENKTYELWLIPANGTAPVPAGLFRPDSVGTATLVLPTLASGIQAKALAVTVENAAGATTPTMPIVLSGAVPSGT
jgi:anti-sigma-K factor RskA